MCDALLTIHFTCQRLIFCGILSWTGLGACAAVGGEAALVLFKGFRVGAEHARARVGEQWHGPSAGVSFFRAHACLVAGRLLCASLYGLLARISGESLLVRGVASFGGVRSALEEATRLGAAAADLARPWLAERRGAVVGELAGGQHEEPPRCTRKAAAGVQPRPGDAPVGVGVAQAGEPREVVDDPGTRAEAVPAVASSTVGVFVHAASGTRAEGGRASEVAEPPLFLLSARTNQRAPSASARDFERGPNRNCACMCGV